MLSLTQILDDAPGGLIDSEHLRLTADGRFLYVTSRRPGSISVFARDPESGVLTFLDQIVNFAGDPPAENTRWNLPGAYGLAISPDGKHVYLASITNDFLVGLARDEASGSLAFIQDFKDDENGVDGFRDGFSVAVSPDGLNLYATGFGDNAVAVFARHIDTGQLTFVEVIRNREE